MKCPCCKYEYKEVEYGFIDVEKKIKSGKRKGETKVVKEWTTIEQSIGDIEFFSLKVPTVNNYGMDDVDLNICPKCGIVFKEV